MPREHGGSNKKRPTPYVLRLRPPANSAEKLPRGRRSSLGAESKRRRRVSWPFDVNKTENLHPTTMLGVRETLRDTVNNHSDDIVEMESSISIGEKEYVVIANKSPHASKPINPGDQDSRRFGIFVRKVICTSSYEPMSVDTTYENWIQHIFDGELNQSEVKKRAEALLFLLDSYKYRDFKNSTETLTTPHMRQSAALFIVTTLLAEGQRAFCFIAEVEKFLVSLCNEAVFTGYLQEVQAKGSQINKTEMWQLWLSKQIHTQSLAAVRRAVQEGSRSPVKETPVKTQRSKSKDENIEGVCCNTLFFRFNFVLSDI